MADSPPLFFTRKLNGLYPASPAAERALAEIVGTVRVKFTRTQGNNKRLALYWIVLGVAAPMLEDRFEGPQLDDEMLHKYLKLKRGLVRPIRHKASGQIIGYDYDSISFATMTEPQRAAFIDWAFRTLAKELGCTVEELTTQAKAELGA